ncbi:MAG: type II toxin-antitoxin system RelE/ParE family toxin [Roseateles sp.]|uniref:type II toxin-antitoxin system RelE/ParE family toxin n=1 Tax=Roseateles sp. TaxID=1971397 RepID=UPI004037373D
MKSVYSVMLLEEAVADLQRLGDFAIERELASETPDWTTPQRALDAISEGMRLLSWSPFTCRKAELGNGRSRELVVPFGGAGYVVLFEIVGNDVVVGAVRHQREEDYRH